MREPGSRLSSELARQAEAVRKFEDLLDQLIDTALDPDVDQQWMNAAFDEEGWIWYALFDRLKERGHIDETVQYIRVEYAYPPRPLPPGPGNGRKAISQSVRTAVFERDEYACVTCGSRKDLSIDHIVPVVAGGSNDEENLQTMCKPCNSSKGARI